MSPENLHEFFLGSAGVAGALIGLLFVAVSVAGDKSAAAAIPPELYRVRAQAALTTFVNSLVVSLVALIPADALGTTALVAALMGLASVVGSLFVLLRRHQSRISKRDVTLLASLFVLFLWQCVVGWSLRIHPDDVGAAQTLAVLVVFSFVTGIARAWELIGAPASISVGHESLQLLREEAAELAEHNHTSHRRPTGDDDAPAAPH